MGFNRSTGLIWVAIWSMTLWAGGTSELHGGVIGDERHRSAEQIRAADEAYDRADYRGSLDALTAAVKIAEEFGSRDLGLALTLSRLGSVYLGLGRLRQAEDSYLKSMAAWQAAAPLGGAFRLIRFSRSPKTANKCELRIDCFFYRLRLTEWSRPSWGAKKMEDKEDVDKSRSSP